MTYFWLIDLTVEGFYKPYPVLFLSIFFISLTGSDRLFWKWVIWRLFFNILFYKSKRTVFYFYLGWSFPQRCHFGYWMFCCLLLHFPSHSRRAIPRHSSCKLFLNWISDISTIILESTIKDFFLLLIESSFSEQFIYGDITDFISGDIAQW